MSEPKALDLLRVVIGGAEVLIDADRVLGNESRAQVQRNPTDRPPWGWLLGSADGLEVFRLGRRAAHGEVKDTRPLEVLILERPSGASWGLLVDRAAERIAVDREALVPIRPSAAHEPYDAFVRTPAGPRLLLDPDRLHPQDLPAATAPASAPLDSAAAAAAATGTPRMVWARLGGPRRLIVGLSARQVVEVCPPLPYAPAIDSGQPLVGFVEYEGELLPAADFGRGLGSAPALDRATRMLVARGTRSERRVALPVPAEVRSVQLPVDGRPRPGAVAPWLRGIFEVEDGLLIVPDLDAVAG